MYIDTDLLFDDLVGYEFYHKCEVKAAIGDRLKCEDGEVLEFSEDVEYLMDEYDEIIVFKRKQTVNELEQLKKHCEENGNLDLISYIESNMEIAKRSGAFESYACVHNDTFYDLYAFSL